MPVTGPSPSGECIDFPTGVLLSLLQLMPDLKLHPELRLVAEPVGEPKGRVARDCALTVNDLADAIGRDVKLTR